MAKPQRYPFEQGTLSSDSARTTTEMPPDEMVRADPMLLDKGRASAGQIAMVVVGIIVIVGAVLYGLLHQ